MALTGAGSQLSVEPGTGEGIETLWLVGYDRRHVTPVASGENRGRTLTHTNVVRSLARLGDWQGRAMGLASVRPEGERVAVLLQAASGAILGVATL